MDNIDLETLNSKLDSILEDNSDNLIYVNVIKLLQDEIYYTYNTDDYTNDFGEKLFYLSPDSIDISKEDLYKILENIGQYIKKDWILTVSDMVSTVLANINCYRDVSEILKTRKKEKPLLIENSNKYHLKEYLTNVWNLVYCEAWKQLLAPLQDYLHE